MSERANQSPARKSIRPLATLLPYLKRYRHLVIGAGISLVIAAVTTLTLPLAVRRMVDNGFSNSDSGFINTYFSMLMMLAIILLAIFGKTTDSVLGMFEKRAIRRWT